MKKKIILSLSLCLMLCMGIACLANAEMPFEEDTALYERFTEALAADGFTIETEDTMSKSVFNYDGVDFTTVSYVPIQGLTYNIDYENGEIFMVFLSIEPDTAAAESADTIILALLRLVDSDYTDDAAEVDFMNELRQGEEMLPRGEKVFQIFNPNGDDVEFTGNLNVMVYY